VKEVCGRTMQVDESSESLSSSQSDAEQKVVSEFPTMTDTKAPTCVAEVSVELATEPCRSRRICTKPQWYPYKVL